MDEPLASSLEEAAEKLARNCHPYSSFKREGVHVTAGLMAVRRDHWLALLSALPSSERK